jgi:hypothetical protein
MIFSIKCRRCDGTGTEIHYSLIASSVLDGYQESCIICHGKVKVCSIKFSKIIGWRSKSNKICCSPFCAKWIDV